jgi:multiple sugar transport system ATP-binding protein
MARVVLDEVSRVHADGTKALSRLSLQVADGELMMITGPSGCGKTTTLRVIAGLEPVTTGTVTIGDDIVNDLPTRHRDVALVTQQHTLYPHMTVGDNLRFALRMSGTPRPETEQRVAAESRVLGIDRLLDRLPRVLSAGHRQSAALGRATARVPRVFLLDEPLSALDAAERVRVRAELHRYVKGTGVTTLYVANDQAEVMSLADRVALLRDGLLQQVGTPQQLLDRPVNQFVAGFAGLDGMSFLSARLEQSAGLAWFAVGGRRLRLPGGLPGTLRSHVGSAVTLGLRPHQLGDAAASPGHPVDERLPATVRRIERLGAYDQVVTDVAGAEVRARFDTGTAPAPGSTVELTVQTRLLQVFDPVTTAALWHGRQ